MDDLQTTVNILLFFCYNSFPFWRLRMKILIFLFFTILLFTGCGMNTEEKIDNIFAEYNKPGYPGAAVMIISDGEIILQKGYGLANVEDKQQVTAESNFRLASVTKQFTAMAALILIERNELTLETTLKEIFPEFPEHGSSITIKQLLQHTSGLYDYEDLIADSVTVQLNDKNVLDLMMTTKRGYFEPGSKHRYSNTGYALLALTVEKVSGIPFRSFLKENIFNPLEMHNTIAYENGINEVSNRAYGYTISNNGIELTDQSITSAVLGDGGIYSNLHDLYKWDQALYTTKLINQKHLTESWTRGVTCEGTYFPYGYGWHLENRNNEKVIFHTGSTRGFRNIIYRIPEKKFSIIILINRNAGEESITLNFAHAISDIYYVK
jgi:CubicO group peptidase (beta-lactamase class C family)